MDVHHSADRIFHSSPYGVIEYLPRDRLLRRGEEHFQDLRFIHRKGHTTPVILDFITEESDPVPTVTAGHPRS